MLYQKYNFFHENEIHYFAILISLFLISLTTPFITLNGKEINLTEYQHKVSICAFFKNEEKFIKEWIEYHKLIGVDHFYLYNTKNNDNSKKQVQSYITQGVVTWIDWPSMTFSHEEETEKMMQALAIQIPAYEHAAKYEGLHKTKWLIVLDVNEYLVPGEGQTLGKIIEKYDRFPGISLKTDFFDASQVDFIPKRHLLIQTVELSIPPSSNPYRQVRKMLFKPEYNVQFSWPPYQVVFSDGENAIGVTKKELKINRYTNRFKGAFKHRHPKQRVSVDNRFMPEEEIDQILNLGYEIEDFSKEIFRFVPQLLKNMGCSYE